MATPDDPPDAGAAAFLAKVGAAAASQHVAELLVRATAVQAKLAAAAVFLDAHDGGRAVATLLTEAQATIRDLRQALERTR